MKKVISVILSAALVFTLASCTKKPENDTSDTNGTTKSISAKVSANEVGKVVYPKAIAFDDYESKSKLRNENEITDEFLNAQKGFAYKAALNFAYDEKDNTNISPISLYYALAVSASGASGNTEKQLLGFLGANSSGELSENCGKLYRLLYSDNKISKLKIANSLWMDKNTSFKSDFTKNAADNFYASSWSVDFTADGTGKEIGKWISDNTNGTLSPDIKTSPEQILSIINTIYFKDQWTNEFEKKLTAEDTFSAPDGKVKADFMNAVFGSAPFSRGDGFTRASLYLKSGASMVFVLPDEGTSIKDLMSSEEKVQYMLEGGTSLNGKVTWKIPKFSFDCSYDFTDPLKKLGITDAFGDTADFSAMTDSKSFISSIIQGTHIAIDENGVEASAFTDIKSAGSAMPTDNADMILDRPFIYALTASNGTVLFIGICNNPTA